MSLLSIFYAAVVQGMNCKLRTMDHGNDFASLADYTEEDDRHRSTQWYFLGQAVGKRLERRQCLARCECMQCLAHSETAVTETLMTLSAVPHGGPAVRLGHLIGQRFQNLADATGAEGPFGKEGEKARIAIADYREHEHFRSILCHGVITLSLERSGNWIAIFKLTAIRSRECTRSLHVVTQADATILLDNLKKKGRKLGSTLGNLRKQVSGGSTP